MLNQPSHSLVAEPGTLRPMLRLALPVLLEKLLHLLVGMVDTWLAGRYLEDAHLAAIGLIAFVLWLLPCLFATVSVGTLALVARSTGAGDRETAQRVLHQSLLLGAGLAIVAFALALIGRQAFATAMQLQAEAAPLAARYLLLLAPAIPCIMLQQIGGTALRAAGDTFSPFLILGVVNLVNAALSTVLVIGVGPFPAWGWEGLAISTLIGHLIGGALMLLLLVRGRAGLHLEWKRLVFDWPTARRILRVGLPGGGDMLAIVLCHLWFLSIVNRLGTTEAAAHSLGIRIESLAFLPGAAFQTAAAALTGQYLGAGDRRGAARAVLLALAVGGSLMTWAGVFFYFAARPLAAFFLGDEHPRTLDLCAQLLQIVSFAMPALAVSMILSGALGGAGDTRFPLLFTFLGFLGVRIPLAYWLAWETIPLPLLDIALPGWGFGVIGAWLAMVIDLSFRALLVLLRFRHGGWSRLEI